MGEGKDNVSTLMGARRLADAVRAAKIAAAHRSDVTFDIREADRARLEIFAEELAGVIREVPVGDDRFDFSISGGQQPRYWIDATAHVTMARDRRTYRFVRETRLGRLLLAESPEAVVVADRVTDYIAERIVEREKALADTDGLGQRALARTAGTETGNPLRPLVVRGRRSFSLLLVLCWLVIGMVIGAAILYGLAVSRGLILK